MTRLDRTPLVVSEKIDCAVHALAAKDRHGAMSELSREIGISRPTLYEARETASSVLETHFKEPEGNAVHVVVDEAQLKRGIAAMRAMSPTSIRRIEDKESRVRSFHVAYHPSYPFSYIATALLTVEY